jgi:hypothetical protein
MVLRRQVGVVLALSKAKRKKRDIKIKNKITYWLVLRQIHVPYQAEQINK